MSTPTLTSTPATSTSTPTTDVTADDLVVITIPASDGLAGSEPVHHVISASSYAADITDPAAEASPARNQPGGPGPALLGMLLAMIAVGAFLTQFTDAGQEIVLAAMLASGLATAGVTQALALRARIHP